MEWFVYAVIAMLLQGVLVFFIKLLSPNFSSVFLLFMQYTGGLISVLFYVLIRKFKLRISRHELCLALLSGFLVSTGLSFYYTAIKLAPVSIVSPLQSVGIILMQGVLGVAFLKEKVTRRVIAGIVCSVLCIIFLTF